MIFKSVPLFIFKASSALLCTIWSWWSKCQNTIRKVVFVVFPVQPESESTRNLLRKAVVIGHKTSFVRSRSLRKVAEITPCSKFKSSTKRGYSRFEVHQMSHTQNAPYYFSYTYSIFDKLNFFVVFEFFALILVVLSFLENVYRKIKQQYLR